MTTYKQDMTQSPPPPRTHAPAAAGPGGLRRQVVHRKLVRMQGAVARRAHKDRAELRGRDSDGVSVLVVGEAQHEQPPALAEA